MSDIQIVAEIGCNHNGSVELAKKMMKKAKEAGYEIEVYHVGLAHPDINVARVQARVSLGGHHIDETVIRKRFHESQENLKAVIDQKLADNLCVIDNSGKSYSIGFVT